MNIIPLLSYYNTFTVNYIDTQSSFSDSISFEIKNKSNTQTKRCDQFSASVTSQY